MINERSQGAQKNTSGHEERHLGGRPRRLPPTRLASASGRQRAAFLNGLPEEAAVVEGSGTIMAVDEAWRRFAKDNGADPGEISEGANYLGVCDGVRGEHSEYARSFAGGLRCVLRGMEERFALEYPCHSPQEKRWLVGSVGRLTDGDAPLALVAHENVTGRRVRR
jgi:hypothetical protein